MRNCDVDCPECRYPLDDMSGRYWYCTSWNCSKVWLTKKTLRSVKLGKKLAQKLIDDDKR